MKILGIKPASEDSVILREKIYLIVFHNLTVVGRLNFKKKSTFFYKICIWLQFHVECQEFIKKLITAL